MIFYENPNFIGLKWPKYICLRKSNQLLLIKTTDLAKIPAEEHEVVDFLAADERSASEILFLTYLAYVTLTLHNYKNLKITKLLFFLIFSILSAQEVLMATVEGFVEKKRRVSLI